MTVVDVHTHMFSEEWVKLLHESDSRYFVEPDDDYPNEPGQRRIGVKGSPYRLVAMVNAMFDYDLRVKKMDEAGVDVSIVSLTAPQTNFGDRETSLRAAQVMNDDMAAAQDRYKDRIRHLAAIPWLYPDVAVAELERACANGAVGVFALTNINGDSAIDERFAPVWQAIDDRRLPVLLHPTAPPGVEVIARQGLENSVGFHFDTTHVLERMMNTGFLDRYPNLTIIGSHAGGFLPFVFGRLEAKNAYREPGKRPGDYLSRIYVDSMAFSPDSLDLTVKVMSPDNILFGSDYPHLPHRLDGMNVHLGMVASRPNQERQRIRGQNAEKIFNL